jgi:plasmid stabilization system protein ParE
MAYQIIWLPKAEHRFDEFILYLQKNWTEKEVIKFIERTEQL